MQGEREVTLKSGALSAAIEPPGAQCLAAFKKSDRTGVCGQFLTMNASLVASGAGVGENTRRRRRWAAFSRLMAYDWMN
ncbi:hypothetical protein DER46DRAFT_108877 [Fusarium sp. MPI-SDFR-AT-0072]|nr:hypothetical protein DER46DRAFT_108877 [Fusarium sp. MPI-SDFR-AT-0072]